MSEVAIGWLREDGTITFDRDEITGHFRRVVSTFKNSDAFIDKVNTEWDEVWANSRKKP